jgi:hypothetical protein
MFDPVKYAQEPTNSKEENELIKWVRQLSASTRSPTFLRSQGSDIH